VAAALLLEGRILLLLEFGGWDGWFLIWFGFFVCVIGVDFIVLYQMIVLLIPSSHEKKRQIQAAACFVNNYPSSPPITSALHAGSDFCNKIPNSKGHHLRNKQEQYIKARQSKAPSEMGL